MAKSNPNNPTNGKADSSQGIERTFSLISNAVKDLKVLCDSADSVSKTAERRKSADTDNAVKVSKAETEAQKEENRHNEAMAHIEMEYKKLSEASAKGELKWSMVRDMVYKIMSESDKLIGMNDEVFLSEESRMSRENLHKTMLELTKEILRA